MIMNSDRKNFFSMILTNYMFIKVGLDAAGFSKLKIGFSLFFNIWFFIAQFTVNNCFANTHARITNKYTCRTGYHLLYLTLRFAAERAEVDLSRFSHNFILFSRFLRNHFINQSIVFSFFGRHVVVSI